MKIIKNTALVLFLACSLGSVSIIAQAVEPEKCETHSPNEAVMHLEKAKTEIMEKDFVPPSNHLKAAREESQKVTGDKNIVKKAHEAIIEAQIKISKGDLKGATAEMDKALELYKSLEAKK